MSSGVDTYTSLAASTSGERLVATRRDIDLEDTAFFVVDVRHDDRRRELSIEAQRFRQARLIDQVNSYFELAPQPVGESVPSYVLVTV